MASTQARSFSSLSSLSKQSSDISTSPLQDSTRRQQQQQQQQRQQQWDDKVLENGIDEGNTNRARSGTTSQQTPNTSSSPSSLSSMVANAAEIPRPKRIACVVCRKRKLRCDGIKPSCGTCSRLGHDCAYDEIRRKSGPKRGYVKALEARLAQVETLLKDQSVSSSPDRAINLALLPFPPHPAGPLLFDSDAAMDGLGPLLGQQQQHDPSPSPNPLSHYSFHCSPMMDVPPPWSAQLPQAPTSNQPMSWDMIAMGLEEALPDQDVVDAL